MPETMMVFVPVRSDGVLGDMPVRMSVQCATCSHKREALSCEAFDEIPEAILTGQHDHTTPYPGDHGIRFEPLASAQGPGVTN